MEGMGVQQLPGSFYVSGCDAQLPFHCANSCPAQEHAQQPWGQHWGFRCTCFEGAQVGAELSLLLWRVLQSTAAGRTATPAGLPTQFCPGAPLTSCSEEMTAALYQVDEDNLDDTFGICQERPPQTYMQTQSSILGFSTAVLEQRKSRCALVHMLCSVPEQGPVPTSS